jgi:hypothetical protein
MKRIMPLLFILLMSASALAQEQPASPAKAQDAPVAVAPAKTNTVDPFEAQFIPRNSRVYIAPFKSENAEKPVEGFETYMAAALRKKNVPLIMVTSREDAEFEIVGTADQKGAGWAKKIFLSDWRSTTSASLSVVNLKTGVIAYADASHRASANKGLRSSAEKLAKYLKKKIEDDEKKLKRRV